MLEAICYRGNDGGADEPDYDEDAAGDARLGFGEAVRREYLVEERGDAVEKADIDGERDEDEPELECLQELRHGAEERGLLLGDCCGGGAGRCWGFRWYEK